MKILLLSPHTDDIELGCGGSLIKFIEENIHEFHWMVFSTAEDSLPKKLPKNTLTCEFEEVLEDIGIPRKCADIFRFPVRNLQDHRQEVLDELIKKRDEFEPDLVIGPSMNDFHQDHSVVAHEMIRAFKSTSSIISYELPWNHVVFNTQMFVKLKKHHIERKYRVLRNYRSQLEKERNYFSKEFIFGHAKMRGIQCNADYAEAFEVIRWVL